MGSSKVETVGDRNRSAMGGAAQPAAGGHLCAVSGGFSLLELLIVLGIMIGLVALIWPSLQRPLVDADLQAGGVQLRDALQQARQDALATGVPLLLQVNRGSGEYSVGPWDQLLVRRLGGSSSVAPAGDLDATPTSQARSVSQDRPVSSPELLAWKRRLALRSERLPEDVVVEEVLWQARLAETDPWTADALMSVSGQQPDRLEVAVPTAAGNSADFAELAQDWFVPMMSNGHSPDVTLILRDTKTGRGLALHLAGSTGMSRLEPLPDGWPDGESQDRSGLDSIPSSSPSVPGQVRGMP
jgi:type II secretory pathway pseudopilin PulG